MLDNSDEARAVRLDAFARELGAAFAEIPRRLSLLAFEPFVSSYEDVAGLLIGSREVVTEAAETVGELFEDRLIGPAMGLKEPTAESQTWIASFCNVFYSVRSDALLLEAQGGPFETVFVALARLDRDLADQVQLVAARLCAHVQDEARKLRSGTSTYKLGFEFKLEFRPERLDASDSSHGDDRRRAARYVGRDPIA